MEFTKELIEKYKNEMLSMAANSKTTANETTKKEFPVFSNDEEKLDKRIEEILMQNEEVTNREDFPKNITEQQNNINLPLEVEKSFEDFYEQLRDQGVSDETAEEIVSRVCIRGGQQANYSPPANTGSRTFESTQPNPDLTSSANFQVEVFAANRAFPIENAIIRIRNAENNSLVGVLTTNENGISENIILAAPSKSLSQTPDVDNPFVNYLADVSAQGYVPQSDLSLQIFGSINTVLPVNLVPVEEV